MKKFNDKFLWLSIVIATASIGIFLSLVSFHSIVFVEPEMHTLIQHANLNTDVSSADNKIIFEELYNLVENPQLFARYENYDRGIGRKTKTALLKLKKIKSDGDEFTSSNIEDFTLLLERRERGSKLGRNTMIFFFLVSLVSGAFYLYERKQVETFKTNPSKDFQF